MEPLREIADWVGQYRQLWDESFDQLGAYLQEPQQSNPNETTANTPGEVDG